MINTEQRSGLPLGLLVVAAMATGGYFLVSSPLESTRHKDRLPVDPVSVEDESVPARSWQDPVMAVHRDFHGLIEYAIENGETPPGIFAPQDFADFATDWADNKRNARPPIVIGILTPGGPFAEDAEVRRRQRHALTTALAQQEGLPATPEHIGYFTLARPGTAAPGRPILVPYEWFRVDYEWSRFDKQDFATELLVLWLSNVDFKENTLNRFSVLTGKLLGSPEIWIRGTPRVVLVGPDNSGDLARLIADGNTTMSYQSLERFKLADYLTGGEIKQTVATPDSDEDDLARSFVAFAESRQDIYENVIARMTTIVHDYLDAGLGDEIRTKMGSCFRSALAAGRDSSAAAESAADFDLKGAIRDCLEQPVTNDIEDSDDEWRASVLDDLHRYANFYVVAAEFVDSLPPEKVANPDDLIIRVFGAMSMAQDFLDFGLNRPRERVADIYQCTAEAEAESPACSNLNEDIPDSSANWSQALRMAHARIFPKADDGIQPQRGSSPAVSDESRLETGEPSKWRSRIEVVSPRASIPPRYLFERDPSLDKLGPSDVDSELKDRLGVQKFEGMIARDDAVMLTIFQELRDRGMRPCKDDTDPIAVLHELDSRYGKILVSVTHDIASKLWKKDGVPCDPAIVPYAYLRGVDGEMPPPRVYSQKANDSDDAEKSAASRKLKDATISLVHSESAVGAAQLDYVRRLADRIEEGWVSETDGEVRDYRAVGVLGADVYDKQLILHALRERLPGVLLFTTDLDARLFSKTAHRWTHNLLVGSSYGLRVSRKTLGSCVNDGLPMILPPPFRDSYQTAFYRSIRHVVCPERSGNPTVPLPRLFEIGRTGPIDITLPQEVLVAKSGELAAVLSKTNAADVHGDVGWTAHASVGERRAIETLLVLLPLLILAASNVTFWLRHRYANQSCTVQAHGVAAIVSSLILLALVGLLMTWDEPAHEPWRLFEGISALPTIVLQISALAFSVCLMLVAWGRICEAETRISRDFFGDELQRPESADAALPGWKKTLMLYFTPVTLGRMSLKRDENGEVDCRVLWNNYLAIGSGVSRLVRAALLAMLALFVIWLLLQPETLFRGPRFLPEAVRYGSAYFSLTLLFFCTDAFKLSQFLLNHVRAANVVGVCKNLGSGDKNDDRAATAVAQSRAGWPRDIYWSSSKAFAKLDDGIREQTRKFEFVLEYTRWVTPLMAYPAVVLALLLISRSTIFDGWTWGPEIIVIYVLSLAYLLVRGYLYQKSAESARAAILFYLKVSRAELIADDNELHADVTKATIDEISSPRQGAFVPWTRHPILQSIALPSGGLGVIALIEAVF